MIIKIMSSNPFLILVGGWVGGVEGVKEPDHTRADVHTINLLLCVRM